MTEDRAVRTILVVDDDRAIRDALARTLAREGFEVIPAPTGRPGWRCSGSARSTSSWPT